jgi:hypothetical protein
LQRLLAADGSIVLADLAAIVAPIFICAGIGYIWARTGRHFDPELVTALVTYVGSPCLVFSALTRQALDLGAIGEMAAAAVLVFAAAGALGMLVLWAVGMSFRSFLPALMFPNAGNMGLPLCLFAFGEPGLALAVVFFGISSLLQFTLGVSIAAGAVDVGRLARLPLIHAVVFALLVLGFEITVPAWLTNTAQLLGGLTIPLMLLALGVSLARLKIARLPVTLGLSLVRLIGGAAIGLATGWVLALEQPARGVLLVQSAMPVAVFNYLFAQLYGRQAADVAAMIVISTLASFLTLPLLLLHVL